MEPRPHVGLVGWDEPQIWASGVWYSREYKRKMLHFLLSLSLFSLSPSLHYILSTFFFCAVNHYIHSNNFHSFLQNKNYHLSIKMKFQILSALVGALSVSAAPLEKRYVYLIHYILTRILTSESVLAHSSDTAPEPLEVQEANQPLSPLAQL